MDPRARELTAGAGPAEAERALEAARAGWRALREEVGRVYLGNERVVEELLCGLIAGGHVLLQGVPGLGKTTLVKSLAAALDLSFRRIQCTPDLMPADVLGVRMLEEDEGGRRRFVFHRGPIFAQVVLADEVNRATPRTQAALLEAMAEGQVTLFGETSPLEQPFLLVATQNPIEMEGTYPLPEAQLDRFLLQVRLENPSAEELEVVLRADGGTPQAVRPVLDGPRLLELRRLARGVPVSSDVLRAVALLVRATHPDAAEAPEEVRAHVRHGASPRGGQSLLRAAQARALGGGRAFVALEDLDALAAPALRHRLVLGLEAEAEGLEADALVAAAWRTARAAAGAGASWRRS